MGVLSVLLAVTDDTSGTAAGVGIEACRGAGGGPADDGVGEAAVLSAASTGGCETDDTAAGAACVGAVIAGFPFEGSDFVGAGDG